MSRRARERGDKHDRWQDERDGDDDDVDLPEPEEETPIHTNHSPAYRGFFMTDTTNILGENMLPLAEIAKPVFNITPRIAQRKAATNTLPVPAFRIGGTRKGPLYVLKEDLEKWVSDRAANAKAQHRKMQAV